MNVTDVMGVMDSLVDNLVISDPGVDSETKQIFTSNIASESEITENSKCLDLLNEIFLNKQYSTDFSIRSENQFIEIHNNVGMFLGLSKKLKEFPQKNGKIKNINSLRKSKYKLFKKQHNNALNSFIQKIMKNSSLNNLLYINNDFKFVKKRKPVNPKRLNLVGIKDVDFIRGEFHEDNSIEQTDQNQIDQNCFSEKLFILKLSTGRCGFESKENMLTFLLTLIEKAGIDSLKTTSSTLKRKPVNNSAKPNVLPNIDDNAGQIMITNEDTRPARGFEPPPRTVVSIELKHDGRTILSSSDKIKNFLYGSNWKYSTKGTNINFHPLTASEFVKSTLYHSYNVAVHKKICELVNLQHHNEAFEFTTIRCCKLEPLCNHVSIIEKSQNKNKPFACVCNMQMCRAACGKAYHGLSECDVSADEATEQLLGEHKNCPGCNVRVHKHDGCNHITCRCRTEFCYVCGVEYAKNEHNHYMVTEHHSTGCAQFDNAEDAENGNVGEWERGNANW